MLFILSHGGGDVGCGVRNEKLNNDGSTGHDSLNSFAYKLPDIVNF